MSHMTVNRGFHSAPVFWLHTRSLVLTVLVSVLAACTQATTQPDVQAEINISPQPPADIEGGAFNASLEQASIFAWEQFIALNWAAVQQDGSLGVRGKPADFSQLSSDASKHRVWETLRAKTELFAGVGDPHGAAAGPQADFGYDQPPVYRYDPAAVGSYPGLDPGQVPACFGGQADSRAPWIELSESHEVGPEQMYSGMAPGEYVPGANNDQRLLFAVKVDREFYRYVVEHNWYDGGNKGSAIPALETQQFIQQNHSSPPTASSGLVRFPDDSIQLKTSWRRLSGAEKASGRFHTAVARSYQAQESGQNYDDQPGNPDYPCFVDSEWGLVGMHIKTRTASAPYYIWATFEHVGNITDENGMEVEDEAGRLLLNSSKTPTDPAIAARNASPVVPATPSTIQSMSPATATAQPGKRLYYLNMSGTATTQGTIAINRRDHEIPAPVIATNQLAHRAIRRYLDVHQADSEGISDVLLNYKLVGVQWKPANKPVPGQDLADSDNQSDPHPNEVLRYPGIYYLANITLETSYRLQNYSGVVQSHLSAPNQAVAVQDLVTDFDARGKPAKNMMYDGRQPDGKTAGFNMGGCMGCHGQIQLKGYDFNFIFRRGRVDAPEMDVSIRPSLIEMVHSANSHD